MPPSASCAAKSCSRRKRCRVRLGHPGLPGQERGDFCSMTRAAPRRGRSWSATRQLPRGAALRDPLSIRRRTQIVEVGRPRCAARGVPPPAGPMRSCVHPSIARRRRARPRGGAQARPGALRRRRRRACWRIWTSRPRWTGSRSACTTACASRSSPASWSPAVRSAIRTATLQRELLGRASELERLAYTDALTHVPNRRFVLGQLAALRSGARRHGRPGLGRDDRHRPVQGRQRPASATRPATPCSSR